MCCCGLDASEKHSKREKGGEVEGWMAPELFFLCVSFWALPHIGADGTGVEKINLTSTLGQETRDSQSILTQLS